ncbi:MAG: anthranilate phosphoribosyltransferase [Deltaproteobacteria bacterium]|nr:anthranilate phosphoribosyltransferase [Deltaproteobacteria bacterium]
MKELLNKLLASESLNFEEAKEMILWIMSEEAVTVQAAALLALLQAKGVTVEEMAGAALAMRERSAEIKAPENAIDTCSTGGNGISTFNISTCAAIIAAGAGAVVAKHGNRSNTRKSGSAEALEALGVKINLELDEVEKCLQDLDICFCYAINHHPAMRFAGPIRKDLGVPTVFNLLGPLTNPAGAKCQLIGVPNVNLTLKIAQVLKRLGSRRVMVVHGHDGLCELTVTSPTHVAELRDGNIKEYEVTPEELGLKTGKLEEICINTPQQSAKIMKDIFSGDDKGTAREIALANAAGALVVSGRVENLEEGVDLAAATVDNGKAEAKLNDLIKFSWKNH